MRVVKENVTPHLSTLEQDTISLNATPGKVRELLEDDQEKDLP